MYTNLIAKDVSNDENIKNQAVTDYSRQVQDKRKISVPSGKDAKPESALKRTKSDQFPKSALGQRSTRDISPNLQSDHCSSAHPEAALQGLSTGEFYFANDPLTQQRIIDQLRHEQPMTYCIRSLDDLEKDGLIRQTRVGGCRKRL